MTNGGRPVPEALGSAQLRWEARGCPPQPAMAWSLRSWQAFLPADAEFLASLPNPIDRPAVAAAAVGAGDSPQGALHAFIAAMVWGYGRVGYGGFRTARVLTVNPQAADTLMRIADQTRRHGGPAAFEQLARDRLTGLGVAFATKYLYFCSIGHPVPPAPILDRLVRNWLATHADWRISLAWRIGDYRDYVQATVDWGKQLGLDPAQVEYLMFADAATTDPTSRWTDPAFTDSTPPTTDPSAAPDAPTTEELTILEILDQAEEAFAALPPSPEPHDTADFEHGLRHLRRIVLSHRRVPPSTR